MNILFVSTSHDMLGHTNDKTGIWLEELAAPYYLFKETGADLTIASPKGGLVPLDPKSESIKGASKSSKRFLKDPEAIDFLSHSSLLEDIKAKEFEIVFVTGGHGALWDIADNTVVKVLLEEFNKENKLIASVGHGVAALVALQNEQGELLVKDRKMTGFSNSEEKSAGLTGIVPFLLETELASLGSLYSKGPDYISYTVVDGNIITGQNPASSREAAEKVITWLKLNKHKVSPGVAVDL